MKIAVVGGGVVGLTAALELQRELRNSSLTVIADSYSNTTSHVAAGIFRVSDSYSGPTEEITKNWIRDSYEYYDCIRKSSDASLAGVAAISGYIFANSSPNIVKSRWIKDLVPLYRAVTDQEFELVGGKWTYGSFLQTLLTQCDIYLPWARNKLQQSGVQIVEKRLSSLHELDNEYNFVINCTGLGARELCHDRKVVPIRGHVTKVKAPWMKTFFYGELDTYVIPGFNGVVTLGGSRHFESENLEVCPLEAKAIRKRCEKLLPSLNKAHTLKHVVGVRPHREGNVRVEIDASSRNNKTKIVHNYGHGGYGVCTAPGTSRYAVELAKMLHKSSSKL